MLERREGLDWISSQANWNQDHAPSWCDMMERPNGQDNNNKNITIINNSWPNRKKEKAQGSIKNEFRPARHEPKHRKKVYI